jgi:hypothetical protein
VVEVRDVAKSGGEGDLRDRPATTREIEQVSRADEDTLLVDVFADRTARSREQPVYVARRAVEFRRKSGRAEVGIVAVTIDIVEHHR